MLIDNRTARGWPLPHPNNNPRTDDVPRIASSLTAASVAADVAEKNGRLTFKSMADLRDYDGAVPFASVVVFGWHDGTFVGGGEFQLDQTDTVTADDGGTVIVDAALRRWKRVTRSRAINDAMFGCRGTGTASDVDAIKRCAEWSAASGEPVAFRGLTYFLPATVSVPSGVSFIGTGRTRFRSDWIVEGTGGHPNLMLCNANQVDGDSDISFRGIVFDFAKPAGADYDIGAGKTMQNGVIFRKVKGMTFENCGFEHFLTNADETGPTIDLLGFTTALFDDCEDIVFLRTWLDDLREEGPCFYKCRNVVFDGLVGNGATPAGTYNTSSFLAFWYCDQVQVKNAHLTHVGGSVFNCCSRNVTYENIKVRGTTSRKGRGFDFGNELGSEPFDVYGISVRGCDIDVSSYGIQWESDASAVDLSEIILIENNRVRVEEDATSAALHGILVQSGGTIRIANNDVTLGDSTTVAGGRCVRIISPPGGTTGLFSIVGNRMRGLCFIESVSNYAFTLEKLVVRDNLFTAQDAGALSASAGAGCFMRIFNSGGSAGWMLRQMHVAGNHGKNLAGLLSTGFDVAADAGWDNWSWVDNVFEGVSANMQIGFIISGAANGRKHLIFDRNAIVNGGDFTLISLRRLQGRGNVMEWAAGTPLTGSRMRVYAPDNLAISWHDNAALNVSTTYESWTEVSAGTYGVVDITGNHELTVAGDLHYSRSTMPANTALPN